MVMSLLPKLPSIMDCALFELWMRVDCVPELREPARSISHEVMSIPPLFVFMVLVAMTVSVPAPLLSVSAFRYNRLFEAAPIIVAAMTIPLPDFKVAEPLNVTVPLCPDEHDFKHHFVAAIVWPAAIFEPENVVAP